MEQHIRSYLRTYAYYLIISRIYYNTEYFTMVKNLYYTGPCY